MNERIFFDGTRLAVDGTTVFCGNTPALASGGRVYRPDRRSMADGGNGMTWYFETLHVEWRWSWRWEEGRFLAESRLINRASQALPLDRLCWIDAPESMLSGVPENTVCALETPCDGRGFYRQLRYLDAADAWCTSADLVQFFVPETQTAWQIGFLTFRRTLNRIGYRDRLTAECDFAGWELPSGASTSGEVFTVAVGTDPFVQLERWADLAAAIVRPQFRRRPALGWLGYSWVDSFHCGEDAETTTLANAQALRERLDGFGFEFIWISIANLVGGNPGDWQHWNERHFPRGPEFLVRHLSELGLKLGLWVGPFLLSNQLPELDAELDEAILRRPDGEKLVYYSNWSHGDAGTLPPDRRPKLYALDPSHPKTQDWLRRSFEWYRKLGVRYYMIDFLEAGSGALLRHPYDRHCDAGLVAGPEVLGAGLETIRKAAGSDTFLLSSTGPVLQVAGYVDAVRVGNDFGEGRPIAPDAFFYPASFVINGSHTAAAAALQYAALVYYLHNKLFLNDSGNVLTVDAPIPLESARIHATIHALSGASTMLGDDLRYIAPDRLALIKKTLPRSPETARPVDLFAAAPAPPCVFHRHVVREWGDFEVVAVYNFSGESMKKTLEFSTFGLPEDCRCQVWEFWTESYLGGCSGRLTAEIPTESVRVFRIVPEEDRPQIVGTDMHVLMGEQEISECVWNAEENSLAIAVRRPRGEYGSVFLRMPQHLRVVNFKDCHIARNRDGLHGEIVIRIPLRFDHDSVRKKLYFAVNRHAADDQCL